MRSAPILIRELQPADRAALQALVQFTLEDRFAGLLPMDELGICVRDYQRFDASQTCYVADVGGTLVGYAIARPALSGEERRGAMPIERLYLRHDAAGTSETLTSDLAPDWSIDRPIASALVNALSGAADRDALAMYDRWGFVDTQVFLRCLSLPSGQGRLF